VNDVAPAMEKLPGELAGPATPVYLRRNFVLHTLEGGLYTGGLTFVASDTVLPAIVHLLNGPNWVVALMPVLGACGGFCWIFTAHLAERLHRMKPFVLAVGCVQRLPFLAAGVALSCFSESHPRVAIALVALAPLVAGAVAGISACAWYELVTRIIPERRRASSWALRNLITGGIGIFAGFVVAEVLRRQPGPVGFGMLHLWCFGFLLASLAVFGFIRETNIPAHPPRRMEGLWENLRGVPRLLREDSPFRRYLAAQLLSAGYFLLGPFLSIHAIAASGRGESFLGDLVVAQMVGAMAGNAGAGALGDRAGGKILVLIGKALAILLSVAAGINHSAVGFLAVFFLLGAGGAMSGVGTQTLSVELCPTDRRPTCLAVLQFLGLGSMLLASGAAAALRHFSPANILPAALLAASFSAVSLGVLCTVREPRGT